MFEVRLVLGCTSIPAGVDSNELQHRHEMNLCTGPDVMTSSRVICLVTGQPPPSGHR